MNYFMNLVMSGRKLFKGTSIDEAEAAKAS